MADFKITDTDTKLIMETANCIGDEIDELSSISTYLSNQVMTALNPYWQGPAKESFEHKLNSYVQVFIKFVNEYQDLNEKLIKTANTYESTDDSVKQLIDKLS